MLTEDRPIPSGPADPAVEALIRSIKRLPRADFEELIDLVQRLHETEDRRNTSR